MEYHLFMTLFDEDCEEHIVSRVETDIESVAGAVTRALEAIRDEGGTDFVIQICNAEILEEDDG